MYCFSLVSVPLHYIIVLVKMKILFDFSLILVQAQNFITVATR